MQSRRPHLILVALILAALAGSAALIWQKEARLGLDLQGGLEVVLKAQPPKGYDLKPSDLDRSISIMRERVDKTGVAEPEIRKQGEDQIVIQLPGVTDTKEASELIGQTAQLELFDLETSLFGPSIVNNQPRPAVQLHELLSSVQSQAKRGKPTVFYLFDKPTKQLVVGPKETRADLLKGPGAPYAEGKARARQAQVFALPEKTTVVTCGKAAAVCPGVNEDPPTRVYYYLFKYDLENEEKPIPQMTGEDLKLSGTRQDFDPNTSDPIVLMQFDKEGGRKFHEITRQEAQRGRLLSGISGEKVLQSFAIVLDKDIKSFPTIDFEDYPDGIDPVNGAQITGIRSLDEAKRLAIVLQTGALPVNFIQIERTDVSATLGKDSLEEAKRAALIGFLIVAIFLLALYRFLGLIAVIGLGIYAAFLYAAILILNVTVTLPGFAGLILTIGVAADANVVIFERIKEEVRAGKSVRAAISAGYAKGFHTIMDANVVTCITALVLFAVATASVKGFALMLLVGVVISVVTAVAATRAMLGLLAGFRWFDNPRFMGAEGQQSAKWLQIDFMRRRYTWFAISGVVLAIGAVSLGARGLNFGIDFRGGTQITFKTQQPVGLDVVRNEAKAIGQAGAVIQGRGAEIAGKYRSFQIRTDALETADLDRLSAGLKERFGENISFAVKNVSSSFGRQIARAAILSIFVSLLLIVLYIAIRFDFKYAMPVIVALIHDILITVGIYSLTAREVSTATVAAILTVLGYSIYDTIIIFDRIRENVPLMRSSAFATIANVSLWETIRRSLATTFITLLPVTSLLIFGGETLKDFAFALLVGIGAGAYSSIFIAAPLLTMSKEREPEYAKRIGQDEPGMEDGGTPAKRRPLRPRGGPALDPGTLALEQATEAAAAEPAPTLTDLTPQPAGAASAAKRERRRQRRRTRPHGRAR
ncbi:MAG: protein translocase subunit SecD [Gaiellaceae bacterium]